jgi:hypothetical protein
MCNVFRSSYTLQVKKTTLERDRERHEAKLEVVREQVASGQVVIRQMTRAEQARWAAHTKRVDARSTPEQRTRRVAGLENRRKRVARLASRTEPLVPSARV